MWLNQVDSNGECGGLLRLPPGLVDYMVEVILNPVPGEDVLEASLADLIIDLLGKYALQACLFSKSGGNFIDPESVKKTLMT